VFVNPQPVTAELKAMYLRKDAERQVDFYMRTVSPTKLLDHDRILQEIATRRPPGKRLLDIGCAAGHFMERARAAGFESHGIDVARWVEKVAERRGVANVRAVSLHEAAFPDEWFDVVHSNQVFEHLPRPLRELSEIRRILKPNGILYLNVPNYRCLSIVLGRDDFELNTPPEHVNYFTPRTLSALVRMGGFEPLGTSAYGGVKWENLLGRPITSEIAEAVRAGAGSGRTSERPIVFRPPPRPSLPGRLARAVLYRTLKVGMTLEIFARRL
jgi:2-polyprenyl-3-methyl-5-hydroxy-6-metoxy-1,4-benzoquinol methylase